MEEIIREYLRGRELSRSDQASAMKLAKDLNRLLDSYSNFHFFLVGDALGLSSERDPRADAVYAMAWSGHCAVSASHQDEQPSEDSLRIVADEDEKA
jgi:phosphatidate phosphatase APP1